MKLVAASAVVLAPLEAAPNVDYATSAWTILPPSNGAVAVLDQLPGWCRLYADDMAVVHVKGCDQSPSSELAPTNP